MIAIYELIKDPYERKARLTPGLLVILPILLPLVCIYGPQHPILTSVLALLGGCGAIYALANIVRGRGKLIEESLVTQWGGMPTTIALRHSDTFLDPISKQRYHDAAYAKLGIELPNRQQEKDDPFGADQLYIGAVRRMRELTRGDKQLLLKENIAYGFHRNMLGMKSIGILTCFAGLLYALLISSVLQISAPYVTLQNAVAPGLAAGLTITISIALLLTWLFYFDRESVRRIGFAYAERLFESLVKLPNARKK